MTFSEGMARGPIAMLEGALGERLKREFGLPIDGPVAMADLVLRPEGRAALLRLWREYRDIAWAHGLPFFATTPTRRANRARMERVGHGPELIAQNVALLRSLAQGGPMCVGGLMGCRGDAYTGEGALPRQEARAFHRWQAEAFRRAGADFLLAGILPTAPEAQGMAQAMAETGLPYVLSLTLRRDGRLVDGTRLCDLIRETDALLGEGSPRFTCPTASTRTRSARRSTRRSTGAARCGRASWACRPIPRPAPLRSWTARRRCRAMRPSPGPRPCCACTARTPCACWAAAAARMAGTWRRSPRG